MNIHEYQAKTILKNFGLPVLSGSIAFTAEEAVRVAKNIGENKNWVVKAQIHAGGRGKAGGVILTRSLIDVERAAGSLLNKPLVTIQTGPEGQIVQKVFIEETCEIEREFYISIVLNRQQKCINFIASPEGGTDIETVAHKTPEKIFIEAVDPVAGIRPYQGRKLAFSLNLPESVHSSFFKILKSLCEAFQKLDTSMIEINPLVLTKDHHLLALDAKMSFDSNALFRHPDIEALRDEDEEDPLEAEARQHDLNYIKLDGNIGCMVNGAGLAMATMDIIKLHGGSPANFLDVGGGATQEKVAIAFKIILSDPNVKAIFINIFGGIMRCDIIAEGIVAAAKEIKINIPIVVRLQGTNRDLGQKILSSSGLSIITADDWEDAAFKVVQVAA